MAQQTVYCEAQVDSLVLQFYDVYHLLSWITKHFKTDYASVIKSTWPFPLYVLS